MWWAIRNNRIREPLEGKARMRRRTGFSIWRLPAGCLLDLFGAVL